MVSELIGKYIWLIQTLSSTGERGLTLMELSDKYERHYGQPYSRRTFNNHRIAILDIFGIDIECDRGTNRYSIHYSDEALDKNKSVNWLIDTFTVNNLLTLGKERLSGRVGVEEIPSGRKFLTPIIGAERRDRLREIHFLNLGNSSCTTICGQGTRAQMVPDRLLP